MNDDDEAKQPFLSHLEELRKRLIKSFIAVGVGFVVAYYFSEDLFALLISPVKKVLPHGEKLIFTNLPEMFFTYLKTAFIAGTLAASPVVFYQIWKFIAPGLYQNEKKYVLPFVFCSSFLFIGGAIFGYAIVFPFGFKFFLSFTNSNIRALLSVSQYLSFTSMLLLAFGVIFELPVVLFFLTKIGIINVAMLTKNRKYAIVLIFIVSAILTPPDAFTQCLMAFPLLALFEIGIFVSKIAEKQKREKQKKKEEEGE